MKKARAADSRNLDAVRAAWAAAWPEALAIWSRFTKLRDPLWCLTTADARAEGLAGSFAMIRLTDQTVVIDLQKIANLGLTDVPREVLAHEIGHHVYCPADLTDQGRLIARLRPALPTIEHQAPFIANLYTDLLINDRLQRIAGLNLAEIYRRLAGGRPNRMWTFYTRIYEILWSLPRGSLATGEIDPPLEGDAHLGARLIRAYPRDWLDGAGRFGCLCLPYLLDDSAAEFERLLRPWLDTRAAGAGGLPAGLTDIEPGEFEGAIHPAQDPDLTGFGPDATGKQDAPPAETSGPAQTRGQHRQPFEYGEILRALGLDLTDHEIAVRYYRERALPHLVRFPVRPLPQAVDPLPEGLESWDTGSPVDEIDWIESLNVSPTVIPGVTTVRRMWGTSEGGAPATEPIDLDIYIDCSGSMPNPQVEVSYLALAGAIVTLSALRTGARIQATLWSGPGQFETTDGFIRDEMRLLRVITGYIAGGTAFPIHILRDTYSDRPATARAVHILVISDDGVTTMLAHDERGNDGAALSRLALERARGGGTLVLNLYRDWPDVPGLPILHDLGWDIHSVRDWDELVAFARQFSAKRYGDAERRSPA